MKRENITMRDGKSVAFAFWDELDVPVKGAVVIVHGMAEHIERYDGFAKYLNSRGYVVSGFDDRGHGKTDENALGIAYGDLFEDTVDDIAEEVELVKKRYGKPVFLIGHSYGSFMTQRFMEKYLDKVCGVILSGSALQKGFIVNFGSMLANMKSKKHANEPGRIFADLTFVAYDKKLKAKTVNEWLTRDPAIVEEFNNNPLDGFICSNGFYKSFFNGLKRVNRERKPMPSGTRLFIASGDADGVGGYGKLVKKLYKMYQGLGIEPKLKLYEGGRHEILNETNKDEVYKDFADFIDGSF